MSQQQQLLTGLAYYQNHQYLNALKHFTNKSPHGIDSISKMIVETLAAVTNIQLCNYNQAALQLNDLRRRVQSMEEMENNNSSVPELAVLKVKILANLMVIMLVNCDQKSQEILKELLATVQETLNSNYDRGIVLFKMILTSLFGFQSFAKMQKQMSSILQKIRKNNEQKNKNKYNKEISKQSLPSSIFLSSYAVYSHLYGNFQQATLLEQVSYQLSKADNPIPAILSLKHLEQLCKIQGLNKRSQAYHQEMIALMSCEELEGIAEETLFRNYRKKMEYASKVVSELIIKQKQWCREQQLFNFESFAVLRKLKMVRNQQNVESIDTVIDLLKKDGDVLKIMKDSQFLIQSLKQYKLCIANFTEIIHNVGIRMIGKYFIQTLKAKRIISPKHDKSSSNSRVIDIDLKQNLDYIQEGDQDDSHNKSSSRQHTPSRKKKDTFASTLVLAKKNIPVFKEQLQYEHSQDSHVNSKINIKPQGKNSVYLEDHKNISKVQEKGGLYKISKVQPKNNKVQRTNRVQRADNSFKGEIPKGKKQKTETSLMQRAEKGISLKKQTSIKNVNESSISDFLRPQAKDNIIQNPKKQKKINISQNLPQVKKINSKKQSEPSLEDISQTEKIKFIQKDSIIHQNQIKPLQKEGSPGISQSKVTLKESNIKSTSFVKPKDFKKQQLSKLEFAAKLRKYISLCQNGQYIEKRHFSSDGGAQRFLQLNKQRDKICWGQSQQAIDFASSSSSYLMQDIRGIVYGKITATMLKENNQKLQPWKCFSLILKKRTFDCYCPQERDILFWLPGLSLCLKDQNFQHGNYNVLKKSHMKLQKRTYNKVVFSEKQATRYYSVGRALWKKFLMKLQNQYLKGKKKEKRNNYRNANAYAIVLAAVRKTGYKLQKMKKQVI